MATHWLSRYFDAIGKIKAAGGDTEGSYRTPIEQMLTEAAAEFGTSADILQEPGRIKSIGAPDFLISAKGGGVVGYVECKQPGADLHKETTKAQVEKYRALSENILLTDSFRWIHLREGRIAADVSLTAKPDKPKRDNMTAVLRAFMTAEAGRISDSKTLAAALAYRCAILRKGLLSHKDDKEESRLHNLLGEFKKALDRDLDYGRFADIFAQTLVYSLLMAKLQAPEGRDLTLFTVREFIPENFAVIRQITSFLPDMNDSAYKGIRWIVGDILAVINGMDKVAIAESMSYKKGVGSDGDPYLNFYEDFLAEYDAKMRKSRGVYYTPPPVVKFIVRAADDLLRQDFNMPSGFAEDKVTALDFAAGTGTFMLEMARLLFDGKSPAQTNLLARGHFLPNFHGFELMTSAFVISHLKLSRFLADNGVVLQNGERIRVWLANTLDRIDSQIELAMMPTLAREANNAQKVKDSPILVIVGNPPYSVVSQNKGKWITDLLRGIDNGKEVGGGYYQVDGKPLGEKNPKVIQDDYVKFIRFAQRKMDEVPRGIVAVITNHAFLDNPTFRGMRQSLMKTFDALYFLDLHGNSSKGEKAPDGGKDENVFDIQQGTAVSLLVKNPAAKKKGVFHADLWGLRKHKYAKCESGGIDSVKWAAIKPAAPYYFFAPFDKGGGWNKYRKHWSVREIFSLQGSGIKSHRDHFAFAFSADEIKARVRDMANNAIGTDALRERYNLKDTRDWKLTTARVAIRDYSFDRFLKPVLYRAFDTRHCYYGEGIMERRRSEVMRHMLAGGNTGLITVRQVAEKNFNHVIAADTMAGNRVTISNKGAAYLFPLYRYENGMGPLEKRENFTAEFRQWINGRYGEAHKPENIFGCIYAVLHSPDFRRRYADFLRVDFPRIPFPESNDEFMRLAAIGNALIGAHLLQKNCTGEYGELSGDGTSLQVAKVRYDENAARLYFNKGEYFAPIPPEVFDFQIGGYKPIDKYLKSRKGLKLSIDDIRTIKKATNAIAFTIAKTGEIDG